MLIERPFYVQTIQRFLDESPKTILILDGPRFAGKSTLLDHVRHSKEMRPGKKYYYTFDDAIGTKQFKDAHDFMQYMQIKHGVDFQEPGLLLLNEIQYSKHIGQIFHDLIKKHKVRVKIIATSIIHGAYQDFLQLHPKDYELLTVHTISFLEFLAYKGFHTKFIDPFHFSGILAQEIQPFLQEFLDRGAYPSVITANTEGAKKSAIQDIIQHIFTKDVSFWFERDELAYFEQMMHIVNDQHEQVYNKLRIKNNYDVPMGTVDRYIQFMENNHLTTNITPFATDKKREVSQQQKVVMLDMGIRNYIHSMFRRRPFDYRTMFHFVVQEVHKHLPHTASLAHYKKINGSAIDLIVQYNNKLFPIVIGMRNTTTIPKVYTPFMQTYNKEIGALCKTSFSTTIKETYDKKPYYTIPYYLAGEAIIKILHSNKTIIL